MERFCVVSLGRLFGVTLGTQRISTTGQLKSAKRSDETGSTWSEDRNHVHQRGEVYCKAVSQEINKEKNGSLLFSQTIGQKLLGGQIANPTQADTRRDFTEK